MSNVQSYKTAIYRKGPSAPLRFLEAKGFLSGSILDYGCGKGADLKFLTNSGYHATGYDPHWLPNDIGKKTFDTILCTYVLNVVAENEASLIINKISSHLSDNGKAFLTVRRDIKKEGFTSRGFQRNVKLNYEVIKQNSNFCIYSFSKQIK